MKEEKELMGARSEAEPGSPSKSSAKTPAGFPSDPSRGVERPILFSGPMVRAILEGRKTQMRRIVKGIQHAPGIGDTLKGSDDLAEWGDFCPYGKPGDHLWVRETWAPFIRGDGGRGWVDLVRFRADGAEMQIEDNEDLDRLSEKGYHWRPSIHMPRWASRITLEVVSVRVERLQDISEEDARAEGVASHFVNSGDEESLELFEDYLNDGACVHTARYSYEGLWESINGAGSWEANPWVWVVEFRVRDRSGTPQAVSAEEYSGEPGGVITATPK